jgi:hypothetical protein
MRFISICLLLVSDSVQQARCRLDAKTRRALAAVNHVSEAMQSTISPLRIQAATGIEIPTPVPSAMYAARHIGHLGISARIAVGTIHFVVAMTRRVLDFSLTRIDASWQHE